MNCPDSKDLRSDIGYTSIRCKSVGSMSNRCRCEGLCYLGVVAKIATSCFMIEPGKQTFQTLDLNEILSALLINCVGGNARAQPMLTL